MFLAEREDGTRTLKLVDFGIARVGESGMQTATGQMLGTPLYMAPEQVTGQSALLGPRTDVWAIGLVAFRLLTGRHYWVCESLPQLALMVTSQPMPAPSSLAAGLGPAFDAWFFRCCARPIEQRFGTVGEAVAALGQALGAGAAAAPASAYAATAMAPAASAPPPTPTWTATPYAAAAGTPAPGGASTSAPLATPARPDGTRNAVLIVAAVLLLGFGAVVVAMALLPNPFASKPPQGPRPAEVPASRDACQVSCAKLAECTGISDPQCETNCKRSPAFAACGAREGCEAVSSCALGAACPGKGPQGTMSCRATADCEGQCLSRGGDPTACMCACVHLMAPDRSTELAANNECGSVRCAEACRKPVNGANCLRCFATSCLGESLACKAR